MRQIVCVWGPSARIEMRKHEISAAIEVNFYDESILLLGAHEKDQVNKWLIYLQKSKKFVDWFLSVRSIVERQSGAKTRDINDMAHSGAEVLSDQMIYKLQQIIDFCESFAMDEQKQVEHFTLQESKLLAK